MRVQRKFYNGYWIDIHKESNEEWFYRIVDDCTKEYIYTSEIIVGSFDKEDIYYKGLEFLLEQLF